MADAMLTELYKRAFEEKNKVEMQNAKQDGDFADRQRQIAIEKNKLLVELIDIRTEQLKD